MKTLDKIELFLEVAGVHGTQADYELYEGKLLPEESQEFFKAYAQKDRKEMLDGLADMEFEQWCLAIFENEKLNTLDAATDWSAVIEPCVRLSTFTYSDVRKALDRVCDSNLTKFDKTLGEARLTAVKYSHIGIDTYQLETNEHGLIPTFSASDQYDINGDFYPKDKLLKSATNYKAPDFTGLL